MGLFCTLVSATPLIDVKLYLQVNVIEFRPAFLCGPFVSLAGTKPIYGLIFRGSSGGLFVVPFFLRDSSSGRIPVSKTEDRGSIPLSRATMPAYSFQERFIPFIEEGSKNCTVRALRLGRVQHVKPGQTMQLYTGLRTKQCRKIGNATCFGVKKIEIKRDGIVVGGEEGGIEWTCPKDTLMVEEFAWRDGFRPEGTTLDNPFGAFELMVRFISKNYGVPFEGVAIFWTDFRPGK